MCLSLRLRRRGCRSHIVSASVCVRPEAVPYALSHEAGGVSQAGGFETTTPTAVSRVRGTVSFMHSITFKENALQASDTSTCLLFCVLISSVMDDRPQQTVRDCA